MICFYRILRKLGPLGNLAPFNVHFSRRIKYVIFTPTFLSMASNVGDGEIVGLHSSSNGRSCESHSVCGVYCLPGDLIRFKKAVVELYGALQEAVACHRIRDGVESCCIGFLPRNIVSCSKDKFNGKFGQILQLYNECDNVAKRNKSHRNMGMASFRLLDFIPGNE